MISLMLTMNLVMTIIFILMKHPLSMGLILLIQTILISVITGNLFSNFWFSYILFLIMVGGMLILFMYMTSIASNEKFSPKMKHFYMIFIPPTIWPFIHPFSKDLIINNETLNSHQNQELTMTLSKFLNHPLMLTLLFLMIYLLLTLMATVKISSFKMGSIRQMN